MSKLDIVIEELTIFETLNSFDETLANWKHSAKFNIEYCDVLAYIPKPALSPEENNYSIKCKRKVFEYELWENHCFAIWRHKGISWDMACEMLKHHRDKDKPIKMTILKNESMKWFEATQIVEYL